MTKNVAFSEKVRDVVRAIPKGEVRTYKEVAIAAGSPHAARAVGTIMRNNYLEDVPCHRVIRSDGGLGGYNRGGVAKKKELLTREGFYKK
ncbi:MGMT family protein [Candidatus Kaiserbacteria bacterium]|nr:MAG: MGMT family protein [Candidatus Kaiserbacteria bacterium]